jgi:hypothetical protein
MSKYRTKGTTVKMLSDAMVVQFRELYQAKRITSRAICDMTGIGMASVGRMLRGDTYKHVQGGLVLEEQSARDEHMERMMEVQRQATERLESKGPVVSAGTSESTKKLMETLLGRKVRVEGQSEVTIRIPEPEEWKGGNPMEE